MVHHAYHQKGIRFFDMADSYGSYSYVGEAIQTLPREEITLLTKIWTYKNIPARESLDRYRQELGTGHINIVLMQGRLEPKPQALYGWIVENQTRRYHQSSGNLLP